MGGPTSGSGATRRKATQGENRSSRARSRPRVTPDGVADTIVELRRERMTYRRVAEIGGVSESTVGRILRCAGLNGLSQLEPAEPDNRYEHDAAGEMLHLDVRKPGRSSVRGTASPATRAQRRRMGVRPRRHRRPQPRRAFSAAKRCEEGRPPLPLPRHSLPRRPDGQRRRRPVAALRLAVSQARPGASADSAVPTANERQGRALHPDRACANGPTRRATGTRSSAPRSCRAGCTSTTAPAAPHSWLLAADQLQRTFREQLTKHTWPIASDRQVMERRRAQGVPTRPASLALSRSRLRRAARRCP